MTTLFVLSNCVNVIFDLGPVFLCRSFEQLLAYEEDDIEEIFCLHFEVCSLAVLVDLAIIPPFPPLARNILLCARSTLM